MNFFLLKQDGGALLKQDGYKIILNRIISDDLMNRKCPSGYTAFISQYIKHLVRATNPWKHPDGTGF